MLNTYLLWAILVLPTSAALAQNAVDAKPSPQQTTSPSGQSSEATSPSTSPAVQRECAADDRDLPLDSTIEAKVTSLLDSAHLKPGKEITVQVLTEWQFPGCNLSARSTLFGHVTTASSSKDPGASELGLVFDKGECDRHSKKPISLSVIGVVAPPDQYVGLHGALPSEVSGGGRNISNSVGNGGPAQDENLNPGGAPHTVHPGIVVGIPKLKLEPHGGPDCSAKLTSTSRSVRLSSGSELILTMQMAPEQK
jgi:hypothetical protein